MHLVTIKRGSLVQQIIKLSRSNNIHHQHLFYITKEIFIKDEGIAMFSIVVMVVVLMATSSQAARVCLMNSTCTCMYIIHNAHVSSYSLDIDVP